MIKKERISVLIDIKSMQHLRKIKKSDGLNISLFLNELVKDAIKNNVLPKVILETNVDDNFEPNPEITKRKRKKTK